MDDLIKELITGAPNLIVALAALLWLSRRMDRVLDVLLTLLIARLDLDLEGTLEPTEPKT